MIELLKLRLGLLELRLGLSILIVEMVHDISHAELRIFTTRHGKNSLKINGETTQNFLFEKCKDDRLLCKGI